LGALPCRRLPLVVAVALPARLCIRLARRRLCLKTTPLGLLVQPRR